MSAPAAVCGVFRFGLFELDAPNGELRKAGMRLKLEAKPLKILEMLVGRPGEIVSRKQIQQMLWPDTHVIFDYSLNTAVNKLRSALGDSAESPRYIETVARRGYRLIARVEAAARPAPSAERGAAISSIAVLPFRNSSRNTEMEYLSDGLSESVIRRVSQIPDVRVMAWSAVLHYKGRENDPRAMGRELGVQSALVGRVNEDGGRVSLSAELVDVGTGWRLWGNEYTRARDQIQTLPEEIAEQIAEKVRPQKIAAEPKRWEKRSTQNPEAYADYLKGRYHWHKLSGEGLMKSVAYFESAIAKDGNFALAHSALADAYVLFAFVALLPPREALEKARTAAQRALEIDEELAEAHASCASITKLYDWDWAKAEREYRRCLEIDPNSAVARRSYGGHLAAMGRNEEGLAEVRKAQELDPMSLIIGVEAAWNLYMAREYEESAEQARRTLEIEPEFPATQHALGLALEQMGKYDEAIVCFQKTAQRSEMHQSAMTSLAHAQARCGRKEEALAILEALQAERNQRYVSDYLLALVYTGLGEKEKAVASLEKALEEHDVWMVWLKREPRFDGLRKEPRFMDLMRRMKFQE